MEGWHDFFVIAGGASAALLGLLFVALSVNKESITARPLLRSLARQTFWSFGAVLVLSLLCTVPTSALSRPTLGVVMILGALADIAVSALIRLNTLQEVRNSPKESGARRQKNRREYIVRAVIYNVGFICFVFAGVALWRGREGGAIWVLPGILLLGALALNDAWGLVLRVDE